jgi:hypothetical protein
MKVGYVPKARIARTDINGCYLDAVINILRAQRQQCARSCLSSILSRRLGMVKKVVATSSEISSSQHIAAYGNKYPS